MGAVISDRRGDSASQAWGLGTRRPASVHARGVEPAGSSGRYWLAAGMAAIFGLLLWTLLTQSPLQVMDAEGAFSGANVPTAPAADTLSVR